MGEERLLSDFFNAAVDCRILGHEAKRGLTFYKLSNESSILFRIAYNSAIYELKPFQTVTIGYKSDGTKGEEPTLTIENMWHIDYQHPNIKVQIDK